MGSSHGGGPGGPPKERADITRHNMAKQLEAMACEYYDVIAIEEGSNKVKGRLVGASPEHVMESQRMLTALNSTGCHIYIAPQGSVGLILVDDVVPMAQQEMSAAGLAPALVVKTSWENFQAWLRVSWEPITPELATATAKELARRFDGDAGAANWRQPGRLSGYTNRKLKYRQPNGWYPYVAPLRSSGQIAPEAAALLAHVAASLVVRPEPVITAVNFSPPEGGPRVDLTTMYRQRVAKHKKDFNIIDWSVLDHMITMGLISDHPDATDQELAWAIIGGSPDLKKRGHSDEWDYATRTVRKARENVERRRLK